MIIQVQNIYLLWDCTQLKDVILLHFNIQQIKLTHFANGFRIDNKKHSGGKVFRLLHPYCLPFVQNRYILLNWKILTPLVCPDKRKWWPSKTASVLKDCHKADRYNVVNGLLWGFPRPFNAGVVGYNTVSPIRRAVNIVHFNFTIQFVECARSFNPLIYPQSLWKSYVYLSVKRTFYLHRVWVTGVLKSVLTTDCCSCSPGWHG